VLGWNPCEGEASGGRRRRSGSGKRWGELGAQEGELEGSGDGRTSRAAGGEETVQRLRGRGGGMGRKGGSGRGVPHGVGGAVGLGSDWRTVPGNGLSAALTGDVRRARVVGGNREGREASDGWVGTAPGGGATDRRV
jgi:hypothetical protein